MPIQWQNSLVRLVVAGHAGWYHLSIRENTWKFRSIRMNPPALLPVNAPWGGGQDNVLHVIDLPPDTEVSNQHPIGDAFRHADLTNPGIDPDTWPIWAKLVAFFENQFDASGRNEPSELPVTEVLAVAPPPDQNKSSKGSQHCLQRFVNERADELDAAIICSSVSLSSFGPERIEWKSPLAFEDYREYQDDFLEPLGLKQHQSLVRDFWPKFGPVWDGLAIVHGAEGKTGVLLLEAKAHPEESLSTCGAAAVTSVSKINQAFARTQGYMGVAPQEWTAPYYQLANRLAFLYFMNVVARVPTWFVLVNFVNDGSHKPTSPTAWRAYQPQMFRALGVTPDCRLLDRIITICPDGGTTKVK